MDIHSIRMTLRTKSIYDIPLRVTYYARVSSESDEQLNSLGNQITYYEDLIKRNKNWTFVPGYIDEGISGISTRKRENFNRMVDDAGLGLFDLVITKEISRFARNTLDSIQFTRQLLSHGVGVFFQNDNINTFDEDAELRLSIMSSIAQDELRKLSSRVKFGHQGWCSTGQQPHLWLCEGQRQTGDRRIRGSDGARTLYTLRHQSLQHEADRGHLLGERLPQSQRQKDLPHHHVQYDLQPQI